MRIAILLKGYELNDFKEESTIEMIKINVVRFITDLRSLPAPPIILYKRRRVGKFIRSNFDVEN